MKELNFSFSEHFKELYNSVKTADFRHVPEYCLAFVRRDLASGLRKCAQ